MGIDETVINRKVIILRLVILLTSYIQFLDNSIFRIKYYKIPYHIDSSLGISILVFLTLIVTLNTI